MAKLTLIVNFETTEEYDDAVHLNRRLRVRGEGPTAADQLGQQVARVLSGLRYVEGHTIEVLVTTVLGNHHSRRESAQHAIPSLVSGEPSGEIDVSSEKKAVG